MKSFIALFALVAVASANPLPLVQIVVNIDATGSAPGVNPVSVDFLPEEATYQPLPLPQPILDNAVQPEEASYDPLPLPQPIPENVVQPEEASYDPLPLPEPESPQAVVIPEPIVIPDAIVISESIPISPVRPIEV